VLLQQSIYLVSIVNTVLQFTVDFNIQKTILSMCIHNTNTFSIKLSLVMSALKLTITVIISKMIGTLKDKYCCCYDVNIIFWNHYCTGTLTRHL